MFTRAVTKSGRESVNYFFFLNMTQGAIFPLMFWRMLTKYNSQRAGKFDATYSPLTSCRDGALIVTVWKPKMTQATELFKQC